MDLFSTVIQHSLTLLEITLFGGKRKKVTRHTIDAMRPVVAVFQETYGIPAGFWRDEFVLGFMHFTIGFHMTSTGITLSQADKGYVIADTFSAISNVNGVALARRASELILTVEKSADFEKGADNAAILAGYVFGILKNADENEFVIKAKKMAEATGTPDDHGATSACMMMLLFVNPVVERFGLLGSSD